MNDINNSLKMEIQSDVFITLIKHLQDKTEVQNIELMNLADFVEIVYQNGMFQQLKKRVLKYHMTKQERLFMGCHMMNGKRNIKKKQQRNNLISLMQRKNKYGI